MFFDHFLMILNPSEKQFPDRELKKNWKSGSIILLWFYLPSYALFQALDFKEPKKLGKSFQCADASASFLLPSPFCGPGTFPKGQHIVPNFISVLMLEGEQSEQPQEELDCVDDDKYQQQFFCHFVVILPVITVLHVTRYCQDLVDEHQDQTDGPAPYDNLLHAFCYPVDPGHEVGCQRYQTYRQRNDTEDDQYALVCAVPVSSEEHEDPHDVSWGVRVPLDPKKGSEEYQHIHDDYGDGFDYHKLEDDFVAGADVICSIPRKGDDEDNSGDDGAGCEQDKEEGFVEAAAAPEIEVSHDADEQQGETGDLDQFVKLCVAALVVQFRGFDADHEGGSQLQKPKEDIEGSGSALVDIDLHLFINQINILNKSHKIYKRSQSRPESHFYELDTPSVTYRYASILYSFPPSPQRNCRQMIRTSESKGQTVDADKEWEFKIKEKQDEIKFKAKVHPDDPRYYTIKANFHYLLNYRIQILSEIGRGGYGVVYKGVSTEEHNRGKELAVKINFKTVAKEIAFIEAAFLTLIRKQRNVQILDNVIEYGLKTHIVTEFFPYTPFIDLFHTLPLEDVKHYLLELLIGLKSLKEKGIFHRDIKPGNFLYNPQLKKGIIIDFGLAELDPDYYERIKNENRSAMSKPRRKEHDLELDLHQKLAEALHNVGRNKIGTQCYMPIQSLLRHSNQNYESDVWAVGVIMLEFVLKKYNIFNHIRTRSRKASKPTLNPKELYLMYYLIELATFLGRQPVISQCKKLGFHLHLPEDIRILNISEVAALKGFNSDLQNLLFRLLELDVEKRISAQEAIKHKFFDSVRSHHSGRKKVKSPEILDI